MQFSAVGALVGGGHYTVTINVNPTYSSFVIGVAGSLIFDWGYDEVVKPFINSASQKTSEGIDAIGDMVGGFFSSLGAVFK